MENNDNSWMKSMLARMEGVPRSGELFVPTNATNLSLGKDGVELSTVAAKVKEGQYAGRESFLEDLMRAFRRSLVAVGPDSDLGRATRGMMKSVKELFMNGLTSYISPGDRVRLPWKTGICDGTVLNIALLESDASKKKVQVYLDGTLYHEECPWLELDPRRVVSIEFQAQAYKSIHPSVASTPAMSSLISRSKTSPPSSSKSQEHKHKAPAVRGGSTPGSTPTTSNFAPRSITIADTSGNRLGKTGPNTPTTPIGFLPLAQYQQLQKMPGGIPQNLDLKTLQALGMQLIDPQVPTMLPSKQTGPASTSPSVLLSRKVDAARRPQGSPTKVPASSPAPPGVVKPKVAEKNEHGVWKDDYTTPRKRLRKHLVDTAVTMEMGSVHERKYRKAFGVERIIGRRYNLVKQRLQYLIKWKDCGFDDCTWESSEVLLREIPGLVLRFETAHPEHPIEVSPPEDIESMKQEPIVEIKFCGFNLQVAMEEWKLVDEASGATTAAPVSFGDHKSVEKIASERTNFATEEPAESFEAIPLAYPRILGSFQLKKVPETTGHDTDKLSAWKEYCHQVGLDYTDAPNNNNDSVPSLQLTEALIKTEDKPLPPRRAIVTEALKRFDAAENTKGTTRWYDPVWCTWRTITPGEHPPKPENLKRKGALPA